MISRFTASLSLLRPVAAALGLVLAGGMVAQEPAPAPTPASEPTSPSVTEPIPEPAPEAAPMPEPAAEPKPESKAETKPEPDSKPETKPATKPEPESKPETKPEPESKPDTKPEPETKPEPKSEAKPEVKSKSESKPDSKSGTKATVAPTSAPAPGAMSWKTVDAGGRDNVTAKGIKQFYSFTALESKGGEVWFRSPAIVMKLRVGSTEMLINGVKFNLSYAVLAEGGEILVSRLDLSKLIDPVLRPKAIQGKPFDTVIIDPGHGGHDTGARGVYGWEKDYTLDLGLRVGHMLQKQGIKVVMTRVKDTYPSLSDRVAIANRVPNSIFVSVHFNDGGAVGSKASGVETYAIAPQGTARSKKDGNENDAVRFQGNQRDSENIALATAVHAAVLTRLKPIDRGIMRDRWFVLKGLEKPGILFEGGFITNATEGSKLQSVDYRNSLATAIVQGILNYRSALRR